VAGLAVWRLTHLLAREDGPADVIARLRARAGSEQLGELMDCFNCASVWVAAPFALFAARRPADRLVSWLALSGVACILERITAQAEEILDVSAETGGQHGMLQPETGVGDRVGEPARPASESAG
jgi:Protein of unknown function (DUF1360)